MEGKNGSLRSSDPVHVSGPLACELHFVRGLPFGNFACNFTSAGGVGLFINAELIFLFSVYEPVRQGSVAVSSS